MSALRVIAAVLANLTGILSANYIVFYILDHYNTGFHFVVHSEFFLTKYLHVVIPILMLMTALIYLLILAGGFKAKKFNKKRLIAIIAVDILLAGAFAMTVNARAFGWVKWLRPVEEAPVAIGTPPPKQTPEPATETPMPTETPEATATPEPTPERTLAPDETPTPTPVLTSTPEPTPEPTPEATPIPGLLGDDFKEKFSEGEPIVTEPNTTETLSDGTVRTLIYTYAGKDSAFEMYHYQKGKQEYQIVDIYVRDIEKLTAAYENNQGNTKKIGLFAQSCNALVAISSDYFAANANDQGLIVRNGMLIRNKACRDSDLCVIYWDGKMKCFDCRKDQIDNNAIIADYPYHTFYFGPSLLDENGNAKTKFNSSLGGKNPRNALGYYRPGHYAFITVLGGYDMIDINGHNNGKSKCEGFTFAELSELCASLGMKAAYNLDGGRSIGMYWNNKLFGHNVRAIGDILAVVD